MDVKELREFGKRAAKVAAVGQVKATATAAKRRGANNYAFYGAIGLFGFIAIGFLGQIMKSTKGAPEEIAPTAVPVEAKYDGGYLTEPLVIDRPGEPQATYTVRKVTYEGKGVVNVLHSRYSSQSGMWFTHARYDCNKGTLFTLGGAETAAVGTSGADYKWSFLVDGSSATQVARLACERVGLKLDVSS
ncbi:hypothetical protein X753_19865 [Mesorhizobium sp. LNJC399B00]|uniref:hypothetical protein n=1 Tax=unclassified Mesorhizobium TaxID=325217 RepID=UPI0003CF827F|nr:MULTISPECIES: hypothetical protein [unclassified Mesorhizobium]ESY03821.1 hypothetical protein X753_19865 [Mesorhizobium sp. LNJC399B00]WJI67249.1 hypothetical protein NLY36_20375 [Mesorhizobium sp. C399B]